jgi:hypothetical protein
LLAYERDELAGAWPLVLGQRLGWRRFGLQRFKGLFDPFHTVTADALIASDPQNVIAAFLQYLREAFHAIPVVVMLRVAPARRAEGGLQLPRRSGFGCIERPADREAFIALSDAGSAHRQRLRAKFRREIGRQERRLEETRAVHYRLREAADTNAVNLGLFVAIEDSGWKGAKGTSIRAHASDLAVFAEATEAFAARGWMEWSFLDAGEETIAAQLAVRIEQRLFLWKVAYREDYAAYAPSHLLLYRLIESLGLRPEIDELNFMNERDWLRPFRPECRARVDRFLFPPVPGIAPVLGAMLAIKRRLDAWRSHDRAS